MSRAIFAGPDTASPYDEVAVLADQLDHADGTGPESCPLQQFQPIRVRFFRRRHLASQIPLSGR